MDFGAFPPEVNSARMYTGPGSAPMLAAASAWDGLAAELSSAALAYQSVINELVSEGWMGPASAAMVTAAAPYVAWMSTTAGQVEQTAAQAKAAVAAFEAAFAMTVPPPLIASNRAQLAALVATNFLGQNTPAIAAIEAHYGQMWAQDTAAMYGYAANAAAATRVTPFASPRQSTNPAGQANQSAGTSAASGVQSSLSQMVSSMPNTLQGLASPLAATPPFFGDPGDTLANGVTNLMSSSFSPMGLAGITEFGAGIAIIRGAALAAADPLGLGALDLAPGMLPGAAAAMGAFGPAGLGGSAGVAAAAGRATMIGALSVPQSWAAATPAATSVAPGALVSSWATAVPDAAPGGTPGMPGMPMAGSGAGRGIGFSAPRYGFKPTVMARPVIAG